jgi:hypothetical protein
MVAALEDCDSQLTANLKEYTAPLTRPSHLMESWKAVTPRGKLIESGVVAKEASRLSEIAGELHLAVHSLDEEDKDTFPVISSVFPTLYLIARGEVNIVTEGDEEEEAVEEVTYTRTDEPALLPEEVNTVRERLYNCCVPSDCAAKDRIGDDNESDERPQVFP